MSRLMGTIAAAACLAAATLVGCSNDSAPSEPPVIVGPPGDATSATPADPTADDTTPGATETGATDQPGTSAPTEPTTTDGPSTDQPTGQAVTITDDEEHTISDAASSTVHCDAGGDVVVAVAVEATITGVCDDVEVRADGAVVTVEQVDTLEVHGVGNEVTASLVGDLEVDGNDNVVAANSVEDIDIDGDNNTITHGSAMTPEVDDNGTGNQVTQG